MFYKKQLFERMVAAAEHIRDCERSAETWNAGFGQIEINGGALRSVL